MGIKQVIAIIFLCVGLLSLFRKQFSFIFIIGIILLIIIVVIRLLADLYWWGKDKGKWH